MSLTENLALTGTDSRASLDRDRVLLVFHSGKAKEYAALAEQKRLTEEACALAQQASTPATRREAAEIARIASSMGTAEMNVKLQATVDEVNERLGSIIAKMGRDLEEVSGNAGKLREELAEQAASNAETRKLLFESNEAVRAALQRAAQAEAEARAQTAAVQAEVAAARAAVAQARAKATAAMEQAQAMARAEALEAGDRGAFASVTLYFKKLILGEPQRPSSV